MGNWPRKEWEVGEEDGGVRFGDLVANALNYVRGKDLCGKDSNLISTK